MSREENHKRRQLDLIWQGWYFSSTVLNFMKVEANPKPHGEEQRAKTSPQAGRLPLARFYYKT
jgi:hypothetical protein